MFPIRLEVLRRTHQQDEDLARAIQKYKALATCPQGGTAKAGRGAAPPRGGGAMEETRWEVRVWVWVSGCTHTMVYENHAGPRGRPEAWTCL